MQIAITQLIHHHYHQRSPTWSSLSEEMESPAHSLSSSQLAAMLQRQFDEEDRLLAAERAELVAAAAEQQRVFDCGVCMDTLPEESVVRIEPCGHSFCGECVRGLIMSRIESRHFPVCVQRVRQGQARTARN
jgi:hypothetical protein